MTEPLVPPADPLPAHPRSAGLPANPFGERFAEAYNANRHPAAIAARRRAEQRAAAEAAIADGAELIDGRGALALVIIRPSTETEGGLTVEAQASGISKPDAAYVLRQIADRWDAE